MTTSTIGPDVQAWHYSWAPINHDYFRAFCKRHGNHMRCELCDGVLIDRTGRLRTKEQIWWFALGSSVIGHAHQGCAYGVEAGYHRGIPYSESDPNNGKPPPEWK